LADVGEVLLPGGRQAVDGPLLRVEEAWVNAQPEVAEALRPALERLEQLRGRSVGIRLAPEGIDCIFDHFRTVQAEEVWACLGGWVETVKPRFGPGIGERFAAARDTDAAVAGPGRVFRRVLQARLRPLLAGGAVLNLSDQSLSFRPVLAPRRCSRPAWPSRTASGRRPWASRRSPGSADCRR
jgi:amidase